MFWPRPCIGVGITGVAAGPSRTRVAIDASTTQRDTQGHSKEIDHETLVTCSRGRRRNAVCLLRANHNGRSGLPPPSSPWPSSSPPWLPQGTSLPPSPLPAVLPSVLLPGSAPSLAPGPLPPSLVNGPSARSEPSLATRPPPCCSECILPKYNMKQGRPAEPAGRPLYFHLLVCRNQLLDAIRCILTLRRPSIPL